MIFRSIDSNNDWLVGNGLQNYFNPQDSITADIKTALRMFLGECFFATDAGVDWWNLLGGKDQASILLQCRQVIASRDGVTKINSVTASLDRTSRALMVTFTIDTIYSRNSTSTVTVP